MKIKAKFVCQSVTRYKQQETIGLEAVYGSGNESWSKWTPSGQLSLTVTNPDIFGKFTPGKEYYLDIEEVGLPIEE